MNTDPLANKDDVPFINARERFAIPERKVEPPKIDELVTKAVGFPVFRQDPRLISKIVEWNKNRSPSDNRTANYLSDPIKVHELKELLSKPL